MRRLTSLLVAFALAFSAPALGQVIKPSDLVGTWVRLHDLRHSSDSLQGQLSATFLTLDSSGTFAYDGKIRKSDGQWYPHGQGWTKGTWSLAADTLRLKGANYGGSYRVGLKDGRLVWWDWYMWDAGRRDEKCAESVHQRFDSLASLTFPAPPRITLQPADLVGTWTGTYDTKRWGVVIDSLFIGADYTLRTVHVGPADDAHERGTWALLPGDVLKGPLGNIDRITVYLHNGELVRCSGNYAVLKRVGP